MTSLSIFVCLVGAIFLVALLLISFSIRIVPNGKRLASLRELQSATGEEFSSTLGFGKGIAQSHTN